MQFRRKMEILLAGLFLIAGYFISIEIAVQNPSLYPGIQKYQMTVYIFIFWLIASLLVSFILIGRLPFSFDPRKLNTEELEDYSEIRFEPTGKKVRRYHKQMTKHKISEEKFIKKKEKVLKYWLGKDANQRGFSLTNDGIVRYKRKKG
jgi:hypothetical protein